MRSIKWVFVILLFCATAYGAKYFTDLIVEGDIEAGANIQGNSLVSVQTTEVGTDLDVGGDSIFDGSLSLGKGTAADSSALLDMVSTSKGFAPPRMTIAQRDLISTPATGLIIYNTDDDALNIYDGALWTEVSGSGGGGISNAEYNFVVAAEGNSRFEKDVLGWTGSTTAPTLETVDEIEGAGSLSWDPVGAETLRSDAYLIPPAFWGTNCYAEISYTGGDADYVLKVLDGSNVEVTSSGNGDEFEVLSGSSKIIYLSFVCPSSGSVKLSLEAGSNEPEIIIDRAYVGSNFRLSEVNQAVLAGESYFAATTNCAGWVVTSVSAAAFATDADCPGPTIVRSQLGEWQTTDSNLPMQTINNLPPGIYKATFLLLASSSAASGARYHINDGTTTSIGSPGYNDTNSAAATVSATFEYTSQGNRSFQLYGSAQSGSVTVTGSVNPTNFILERFPSASQVAYTPPSQGDLVHNVYYDGYTGVATYVQFATERQNTGGSIITVTNSTHTRYTMNVPAFCTASASGSRAAGGSNIAIQVRNSADALLVASQDGTSSASEFMSSSLAYYASAGDYFVVNTGGDALINTQNSSFSISCKSTKQSSAPLLVNSVVSDYSGVLTTKYANIDCDGSSSITSQIGSWISSVGNIASGQCSVTLAANSFSTTGQYCFATEVLSGAAPRALSMTVVSATSLTIDCVGNTGSDCSDFDAFINCVGPK